MRMLEFSKRTVKEIMRDMLTLFFGLVFPLVLLFLLTAIQRNIPVSIFELPELTPGITVFGLSFLTLFSAMLISRDRETAFMMRLYTTPLTATDFILGYALPFIPIALLQGAIVYAAALIMGLGSSSGIFWTLLGSIPISLIYIGMGLLFGSTLNSKAVGGIAGALVTNLSAWLSGTWFDLSLVGGAFEKIADLLPFVHSVELGRALLQGNWEAVMPHLWWVLGWGIALLSLAVVLFLRQMKRQ